MLPGGQGKKAIGFPIPSGERWRTPEDVRLGAASAKYRLFGLSIQLADPVCHSIALARSCQEAFARVTNPLHRESVIGEDKQSD